MFCRILLQCQQRCRWQFSCVGSHSHGLLLGRPLAERYNRGGIDGHRLDTVLQENLWYRTLLHEDIASDIESQLRHVSVPFAPSGICVLVGKNLFLHRGRRHFRYMDHSIGDAFAGNSVLCGIIRSLRPCPSHTQNRQMDNGLSTVFSNPIAAPRSSVLHFGFIPFEHRLLAPFPVRLL